jgi:hypothetical protein
MDGTVITKERVPEIINRVLLEGHYFETGFCIEGSVESGPRACGVSGFRWGQVFLLTFENNKDICLWINPKQLQQANGWSCPCVYCFKGNDPRVSGVLGLLRSYEVGR